MTALPQKPWFNVRETLMLFKEHSVSRATVYRWMQSGILITRGVLYFTQVSRESIENKLSQLSQSSHPSA